MSPLLFIPLLLTLFIASVGMPVWIKKCRQIGFLWEDMNKYNKVKNVAASGGIVVLISFILGVLLYMAIRNIIWKSNDINMSLFALLTVILILTFIGLLDDLCGWKYGGLSVRLRLFFAFMASIPLIIIHAGTPIINIPFLGVVDLGILYALVVIPVGVVGATSTFNFLASYNGLEAGQGIIILSFLSFVSYITGSLWLAFVGLLMIIPLIIFYLYNKFPSKIFPGDSLTWAIGALIACMAILGNFERIALFVFSLYIFEAILKIRGKLKKYSFAKPNKDGSLELSYEKIYSVNHLALLILKRFKKKVYEKDIVNLIFMIQITLCLLAVIIFRQGIF
jgi:UDP-N-acetylglucosamine--dolichyl-phosphate N-acetylglucosaminephosphotransferase